MKTSASGLGYHLSWAIFSHINRHPSPTSMSDIASLSLTAKTFRNILTKPHPSKRLTSIVIASEAYGWDFLVLLQPWDLMFSPMYLKGVLIYAFPCFTVKTSLNCYHVRTWSFGLIWTCIPWLWSLISGSRNNDLLWPLRWELCVYIVDRHQ